MKIETVLTHLNGSASGAKTSNFTVTPANTAYMNKIETCDKKENV